MIKTKNTTARASIVEVAKLSKLSTATVSRVMNNAEDVMPETRDRVMEAAQKLNYRPNLQARGLRKGMNEFFGLLMSKDIVEIEDTTFLSNLINNLIRRAAQEGYGLISEILDSRADGKLETPRIIGEFNVAGVLLLGYLGQEYVEQLLNLGKPTCLVGDYAWTDREVLSVEFDFNSGMRDAVRYLSALGHRRIAFVHGNPEYPANIGKKEGFLEGLKELGLEQRDDLLIRVDEHEQNFAGGKNATQALLRLKSPPTAICYANDWFAVGGLNAAAEKGLKVPEDLSIMGYDNSYIAKQCSPRLSSVCLDYIAMTDVIINKLVRGVRRQNIIEHKTLLRPNLAIHGSCAPNRKQS